MPTQALATESDARAIGTVVDWPKGESLGDWQAVALLGRGGTAEVWHAVTRDGREAALKLVKRELRRHSGANALIRREHELLRTVASAYLVAPYELIDCDDCAVSVLEFLPHGDLVSMLGTPVRHWLPAFADVVAALVDLERHGLAHGDLKPRNVLFAAAGSARLADLVSARPLDAPAVVTTAAYGLSAPGRARDADCFALAALLLELLTGRLPYGPAGASPGGAELPAVPSADGEAAPLLAAATAALRAQGRVKGLSYFSDVIESVRSTYG
jgi:serine/threonine protein kinase